MAKRWEPDLNGVLVEYDTETGEITAAQKTKEGKRSSKRKAAGHPGRGKGITEDPLLTKHNWVQAPDGRMIIVPPGTEPKNSQQIWTYSKALADAILEHVVEGARVPQISELPGFPPKHVIWRWLRELPDFKRQYEEARRIAAYEYEHRAILEAETADEENVQSAKLRVTTYQWAAEVRDRNQFGKSTKITGDASAPIAFTILTGVPQKELLPEPEEK